MKTRTEASKTKKPVTRRRAAAGTDVTPKAAAPRRRRITANQEQAPAVSQPKVDSSLDAEAVRARAYFLYLERNGRGGDPVADWLDAERQIAAERDARL